MNSKILDKKHYSQKIYGIINKQLEADLEVVVTSVTKTELAFKSKSNWKLNANVVESRSSESPNCSSELSARRSAEQRAREIEDLSNPDYRETFRSKAFQLESSQNFNKTNFYIGKDNLAYSGLKTCSGCNGACKVNCSSCRGKGERRCSSYCNSGSRLCSCGGGGARNSAAGSFRCRACGGSGVLKCANCNGTGKTKCTSCRNGKVSCRTCSGKGKINVKYYSEVKANRESWFLYFDAIEDKNARRELTDQLSNKQMPIEGYFSRSKPILIDELDSIAFEVDCNTTRTEVDFVVNNKQSKAIFYGAAGSEYLFDFCNTFDLIIPDMIKFNQDIIKSSPLFDYAAKIEEGELHNNKLNLISSHTLKKIYDVYREVKENLSSKLNVSMAKVFRSSLALVMMISCLFTVLDTFSVVPIPYHILGFSILYEENFIRKEVLYVFLFLSFLLSPLSLLFVRKYKEEIQLKRYIGVLLVGVFVYGVIALNALAVIDYWIVGFKIPISEVLYVPENEILNKFFQSFISTFSLWPFLFMYSLLFVITRIRRHRYIEIHENIDEIRSVELKKIYSESLISWRKSE